MDYAETESWRKGGNVQVGQVKLFGGPLRNIPKSLSWSTVPKKMRKCLWGTSAKRTGVCFLFAYLKKEVICSYSSMQTFELKYP